MKEKWKKAYSSVRKWHRHPRYTGHQHLITQDKICEPLDHIPCYAMQYAWKLGKECHVDGFTIHYILVIERFKQQNALTL